MLKKAVAIAIALSAVSAIGVAQQPKQGKKAAHAFQIQDNSFSYQYSSWMRDPYTTTTYDSTKAQNIVKHIVDFNHIDIGSKFGDNVYNVQYLISSRANPTSTSYFHNNLSNGAKDVYMVYRHNMPFNRLFNTNKFEFGPVKDVYAWFGFDYGTKNDDWANQRRSPMVGLGVALKVPNKGFLNIGAAWTREWNEEGTDVTKFGYKDPATGIIYPSTGSDNSSSLCTAVQGHCVPYPLAWGQPVLYDNAATFQATWGVPFTLAKTFWSFEGFGTLNTSKGYGAPSLVADGSFNPKTFKTSYTASWQQAGTKPELLLRPQLMWNFGKLIGPTHNWQIGAGWEYWNNMYGVDHHIKGVAAYSKPSSTSLESAPFFALTVHL